MNILHLIDHALPYQDGYTARTHYILRFQREMGYGATAVTLPGVQSRLLGKIDLSPTAEECIDGVPYYHFLESQQTIVRLAKRLFSLRFLQIFKTRASAIYHVPDSESRGILAPLIAWHRQRAIAQYYLPIIRSLPSLDLIHAHWPPLNAHYALTLSREFHVPVVYEVRSLFEDSLVAVGETRVNSTVYLQRREADTNAAQKADRLITISERLKQDFVERGIPESKISVVPNGVDSRAFIPVPRDKELVERFQLNDRVTIGYIGSVTRYEGLEYLLRAFPAIRALIPNVVGMIVGDGPALITLQELARDLGIMPDIHFVGKVPLSAVQRYYSLIDVFVVPRIDERVTQLTTPLKPYEAMAMGKALLVSNVGGLTEIIRHNETGIIFEAENVNDLVQQAVLLLQDEGLRRQLGQRAREWIVEERDWRVVIDRYRSIYTETLATYRSSNQ